MYNIFVCNKLCSAWSLCDPGDLVLVPVPTYARLEHWIYSSAHLCQVIKLGIFQCPLMPGQKRCVCSSDNLCQVRNVVPFPVPTYDPLGKFQCLLRLAQKLLGLFHCSLMPQDRNLWPNPEPTYAWLETLGLFQCPLMLGQKPCACFSAHLCQVRNIGSVPVPAYAMLET